MKCPRVPEHELDPDGTCPHCLPPVLPLPAKPNVDEVQLRQECSLLTQAFEEQAREWAADALQVRPEDISPELRAVIRDFVVPLRESLHVVRYKRIGAEGPGATKRIFGQLINLRHGTFLTPPNSGLLLTGSVGVGKTWLAAGVGKAATKLGIDTLCFTATGLAESILQDYRAGGDLRGDVERVPLLILDDVGDHIRTQIADIVYDVMTKRCNNGMPMVITTNLAPTDFSDLLGVRLADRVMAMCKGRVVRMTGKSRRGR